MANIVVGLEQVLINLLKLLNKNKIPHMLVGGWAVNYYGNVRTTGDIDVVALIKPLDIEKLISLLSKNKYKLHQEEIKTLVRFSNRFFIVDPTDTYRIDFWIPKTDYEHKAFVRRKKKKIGKKSIFLISPEDLILFKLVTGKNQDLMDAKSVLERQKGKLDRKYLRFWALYLNKDKELKKLEQK